MHKLSFSLLALLLLPYVPEWGDKPSAPAQYPSRVLPRQAIERDADALSPVEQQANQLRDRKRYEDAIKLYGEAIKNNPHSHGAFANRAYCYLQLERYHEALADINQAPVNPPLQPLQRRH